MKTKFIDIVVNNPSKQRGYFVKYAYKIYSPNKSNPIILIAGWNQVKEEWFQFVDQLSNDRMVIITDHRGIGQSKIIFDPNNNINEDTKHIMPTFTLSDLANDIITLINHLKIKKIDICGHSMGSLVAQEISLQFPQIISNLILLSASPAGGKNVPFIKQITKQWFKNSAKIAQIKDKVKLKKASIESLLFSLGPVFDKNNKMSMDKINQYIELSMTFNKPIETSMGQLKAISKWNGIPKLKTLDKYSNVFCFDIILITGDQDNVCDIRNTIFLNERLTNSKVFILHDVGHMIALDDKGRNRLLDILAKEIKSITNYELNSKL